MMPGPGDNHSNGVRIAADATVGVCQNCSVLQAVSSHSPNISGFPVLFWAMTFNASSVYTA